MAAGSSAYRDGEQEMISEINVTPLVDDAPEPIGSDENADQDEADHRGDADAREQRDDDPRGSQYYQRVGHRVGKGFTVHFRTMAAA